MNKRITSIVLCLVMLVSMMAVAAPVTAVDSLTFTITPDRTEALPGDTITYTLTMSAVEQLGGMKLKLVIPEGLSWVSGSSDVPANLKSELGFGEASFKEQTLVFIGAANEYITTDSTTVLMTFQCTVNEGAEGAQKIDFIIKGEDVFDYDYEDVPFVANGATVTVGSSAPASGVAFTMTADKPNAVPGEVVTFTVTMGAVNELGGMKLKLAIPAGLTFVSGSSDVPSNLKDELGFGEASFKESTLVFIGAAAEYVTTDSDTVLMTFQCTVDEDAALGNVTVDFIISDDDIFDYDYNNMDYTAVGATVEIVELVAPGCDHEWIEADCENPETCSKCGETLGEALGHSWNEADCENAKTCSVCGATEGDALGHDWADADCQNPKTCTVCGATEGEKGDHVDADNDGKCDICGYEKTPETGDVSVMGFVVVLMLALACGTALVCGKKKFIA